MTMTVIMLTTMIFDNGPYSGLERLGEAGSWSQSLPSCQVLSWWSWRWWSGSWSCFYIYLIRVRRLSMGQSWWGEELLGGNNILSPETNIYYYVKPTSYCFQSFLTSFQQVPSNPAPPATKCVEPKGGRTREHKESGQFQVFLITSVMTTSMAMAVDTMTTTTI